MKKYYLFCIYDKSVVYQVYSIILHAYVSLYGISRKTRISAHNTLSAYKNIKNLLTNVYLYVIIYIMIFNKGRESIMNLLKEGFSQNGVHFYIYQIDGAKCVLQADYPNEKNKEIFTGSFIECIYLSKKPL